MELKVGYSQGAKVSNPQDRYENATFTVTLGLTQEIEGPPEGDAEYEVWSTAVNNTFKEKVEELRAIVESELQSDVDKFIKDNSVGD